MTALESPALDVKLAERKCPHDPAPLFIDGCEQRGIYSDHDSCEWLGSKDDPHLRALVAESNVLLTSAFVDWGSGRRVGAVNRLLR